MSQNRPKPSSEFGSSYDIHMQAKTLVPVSLLQQVQLGLGVSVNELAGLLMVSPSTIQKYKQSNRRMADPRMAEQLILMNLLTEHGQSLFKKTGRVSPMASYTSVGFKGHTTVDLFIHQPGHYVCQRAFKPY